MTLLYLVRHGETVDNANHIMQGQTPGELNEQGIKQAEDLAERLKDEPIDAFVSSDLQRSIHTCKLIAAPHGKAVTTTPLLRERDWGSFTGKYIPNLANLNDPSLWPDDIESLDALKARAKDFLTWLKEEYPDKKVLAVGHGIINKAIQSVYFDKPMNELKPMSNAEVRMLELNKLTSEQVACGHSLIEVSKLFCLFLFHFLFFISFWLFFIKNVLNLSYSKKYFISLQVCFVEIDSV